MERSAGKKSTGGLGLCQRWQARILAWVRTDIL